MPVKRIRFEAVLEHNVSWGDNEAALSYMRQHGGFKDSEGRYANIKVITWAPLPPSKKEKEG